MRDHRIDAAKGALIILVVLGHFLEAASGWGAPLLRAPLTAIYMMHMPAFVFLAGMTTKAGNAGWRVATFAVLLTAFQAAYLVPLYLATGAIPVGLAKPYWILWFLLAMMFWTALLPILRKVKRPLAVAVFLSLAAGLAPWDGYILSFSRTFVFLPFFIAGHLYGWQLFKMIPHGSWPKAAGGLLILCIAAVLLKSGTDKEWLYGSYTFRGLGVGAAEGLIVRAMLLAAAVVAMVSAFALMPATQGVLTAIGSRSLAIFLLHGFPVILGGKLLRPVAEAHGQASALLLAVMMTSVTVAVLAVPVWDPAIRGCVDWVINMPARLAARQR